MSTTSPSLAPRSWDSSPAVSRGQVALVTLAALALVPALASTVLWVAGPTDDAGALIASFVGYGLLGYLVALVLLLAALVRARRRLGLALVTALVLGLTTLHGSWLAPFYVPDGRPATTRPFTVLVVNVQVGEADAAELARQSADADVVVLVESTGSQVAALQPYGWNERFPYAVGTDSDTAVFSRLPLTASEPLAGFRFAQWATVLEVPEVGPVRLMAVHPCNPFCGGNASAREHRQIQAAVRDTDDLPLVVAGDFNAVPEHATMRALAGLGLADAADLAGAGWLPTYPADRRFPPLIPIDHVLVSAELTATAVSRVEVAGTDHRGLRATLAGTR